MKHLWLAVFFCVLGFLSAQERSDIKLYISPAAGGPLEAREFFDINIPEEIEGAHYTVVDEPEEADYQVFMNITENTDGDIPFLFTLIVTKTQGTDPLVDLSWGYTDVEEMYQWNLYLVYTALANIPMSKVEEKTIPAPEEGAVSDNRRRERRFFIGLRGGVSFGGYSFQGTPNYSSGYSTGIGGEGGLVIELRLFRFLSFQVEGDFIYDVFYAPKVVLEEEAPSADTFTTMSLISPLMVKVPLKLGGFILSLYAGAYFSLSLGEAEKRSGNSGETENVTVNMPLPFGFTIGADVGFAVGPGELFADFRYGRNFGATVIGGGARPLYIGDRTSVCLGYKFGF